jgi:hypothetical protein
MEVCMSIPAQKYPERQQRTIAEDQAPRQLLLVKADDGFGQPIAVVHSAPGLDVALVEARRLSGAPEHGGYLVEGCGACEINPQLEPPDGCMAAVVMHENGCDRLAGMLARAGVAR